MDPSSVSAIQSNTGQGLEARKKQLRQQCREFESVMIDYMMKTMRESGLRAEEPEHAREVYEDMFSGQVSREVSKGGFFGIGNMLYTKLEPLLTTQPSAKSVSPDGLGTPAIEHSVRKPISGNSALPATGKSISVIR